MAELIFKEELNSTNTYAKEHMEELSDMSFIYCNRQANGKGRLDRVWVSQNSQNIYLTIVLKPEEPNFPYVNLTQYLCVVVCRVLKEYGVMPQIKWPNDILIGGKKIAGILAQTSTAGHKIKGIALGVGINLNMSLEEIESIDKPATSLNLELNRDIERDEFLSKLVCEFEETYQAFVKEGFENIKHDYLEQACFLDTEITVSTVSQIHKGRVKALTKDGAILLCDNITNNDIVITMGEIQ